MMNRWRVVVGGVSMNLALGSLYAWSVFVLPLEKEGSFQLLRGDATVEDARRAFHTALARGVRLRAESAPDPAPISRDLFQRGVGRPRRHPAPDDGVARGIDQFSGLVTRFGWGGAVGRRFGPSDHRTGRVERFDESDTSGLREESLIATRCGRDARLDGRDDECRLDGAMTICAEVRCDAALLAEAHNRFGVVSPFGGPTSSGMVTLHCPPAQLYALGSFLRAHGADTVSVASLDYVLDRDNPLFAKLEAFLRR